MKEKLQRLIASVNRAFITHRRIFLKKSQACGLYVGQPAILNYVREHPGCTQSEIADELGVSSASIAFSTKRLQNAGYLQKQVNSLNMRCNRLYVTPEGIAMLDRFSVKFDEMNRQMFDGFTEEELEQLASFAERINRNLERMYGED